MRNAIERHMNLLLFSGCAMGLVWPYWGWADDWCVKAILMAATFIACFKLNMVEFKALRWRSLSLFMLARYVALPWAVYAMGLVLFSDDIALGVLLVCALPAGVSSAAMTNLLGGQVTLAAIITLLTTLLVPFTMPLLFLCVGDGGSVMPSPTGLLQTLLIILVLPCIVFVCVRKWQALAHTVDINGKAATVLLVALMLAIVVGKQRAFVLEDMGLLAQMIGLTFVLMSGLLIAGWAWGMRMEYSQRVALAVCSGFNNAALGVALAALHFSPMVVIITVAAEVSWTFLPFVMRFLVRNN